MEHICDGSSIYITNRVQMKAAVDLTALMFQQHVDALVDIRIHL